VQALAVILANRLLDAGVADPVRVADAIAPRVAADLVTLFSKPAAAQARTPQPEPGPAPVEVVTDDDAPPQPEERHAAPARSPTALGFTLPSDRTDH
jgi:hypothetical protein